MGRFLLVLHFTKGWSLVISHSSSRQSILTGAQLEFEDGSFQQTCVTSIRNSRYKSWMLKAGTEPTRFSHSRFCRSLLNMHVTFDLSEIEEMMLQQARKQLETELETTLHSFGDVCCLYTAVLVSPVHSPVQSTVQSMVQSRVQLLQRPDL